MACLSFSGTYTLLITVAFWNFIRVFQGILPSDWRPVFKAGHFLHFLSFLNFLECWMRAGPLLALCGDSSARLSWATFRVWLPCSGLFISSVSSSSHFQKVITVSRHSWTLCHVDRDSPRLYNLTDILVECEKEGIKPCFIHHLKLKAPLWKMWVLLRKAWKEQRDAGRVPHAQFMDWTSPPYSYGEALTSNGMVLGGGPSGGDYD